MVTTITQSGPGIASGHDTVVNAPVNIGVDETQVGQRIVRAGLKNLNETISGVSA